MLSYGEHRGVLFVSERVASDFRVDLTTVYRLSGVWLFDSLQIAHPCVVGLSHAGRVVSVEDLVVEQGWRWLSGKVGTVLRSPGASSVIV